MGGSIRAVINTIFMEQSIPSPPVIPEPSTVADHVDYITDEKTRETVKELLKEIPDWKKGHILIEPVKYSISMKADGRVFCRIFTRRQNFIIQTRNEEVNYIDYSINEEEDLEAAKALMKLNLNLKRN